LKGVEVENGEMIGEWRGENMIGEVRRWKK
jgi:hypothetical protein